MIKKYYKEGDTVWIHGVNRNAKLTKGTVVKKINLDYNGFESSTEYYVIGIPSYIDTLLEIRTWETISQDENGPVGLFRGISEDLSSTNKIMSHSGYYSDEDNVDDPLPEEINAAIDQLEKQSRTDTIFKPPKKPRFRTRKTKKNHVGNS